MAGACLPCHSVVVGWVACLVGAGRVDRCRVGSWELGEWTGAGWVVESCGDLIRSWGEWTGEWVSGQMH